MAATKSQRKRPRREISDEERARLKRIGVQKGEVRNKRGLNGWSKARERIRETLAENADDIMDTAVALAKAGEEKSLRLLLGPLLPAQKHEHEHSGAVTFTWQDDEE